MTDEQISEKEKRNAAICAYYHAGHKLSETASHFKLGRQRIIQIVKAGGVWRPYEKTKRTKFLGVSVSDETKEGLKQIAEERGISVSKLASDVLDEVVK